MHTVIAAETLKSGERMEIELVTPPDAERAPQIQPFLAHKPPHYYHHIETAFADGCDELETRFYVGLLDGQMVGNIMTVESGGVGIFGHVHTREDQRRKGICSHIMRHQMEDFRRRGGKTLLLGTGYQSAPYGIYHSFGFRDLPGGRPGTMRYDNPEDPDFEARFFGPASSRPVPARWKHWPLVALLAARPGPMTPRSLTFDLWGVGLLEGPYCDLFYRQKRQPAVRAAVLESETGAVVGIALCVPDERWRGDIQRLECFAHPGVGPDDLVALLESLPAPSGKTQCYADPREGALTTALEWVGFRRDAVLPGQFREGDTWRDLWLYARTS